MILITADKVMELRRRTGYAAMTCKKALEQAGGDPEEAIKIIRLTLGQPPQETPTHHPVQRLGPNSLQVDQMMEERDRIVGEMRL